MRILTISSYFSILFYSILFDLLVDKNSCDGRYILLDCWIFIVQINFSTWTGEKRWRTCREFRTDNLILKQSAYAFILAVIWFWRVCQKWMFYLIKNNQWHRAFSSFWLMNRKKTTNMWWRRWRVTLNIKFAFFSYYTKIFII